MNRNQPTAAVPFDVKLMNITATVMFMGCLTACVMAVGWWLMRTPAFNIGRIVVEGELVHNNAVTLRANVAPVLKGNFFTVDLKAAQHAFEQVPWVQEAQVRREYPNGLRVALKEHVAEAFWGAETGAGLVNKAGEVFEANLGELDREGLPRLQGPEGSAPRVLQMYRALEPALKPLDVALDSLTLDARGSWTLVLDNDALLDSPLRQAIQQACAVDAVRGIVVHRSSGARFQVEGSASPITDRHGAVTGAVALPWLPERKNTDEAAAASASLRKASSGSWPGGA